MKKFTIISICMCLIGIGILSSCKSSKKNSSKSFIARMEVKEPIEGVCDNANVIVILPFLSEGQVEAKAPKTKEEITKLLNTQVTFLKDKPDYEDKGMVNLIINCEGKLVRCQIDNKTKSPELDSQVVAVFSELKKWTPATVNNKAVDTAVLQSFTIKNGKITLN